MDIKEKAKMYAEGKAIDAISAAIEQAYTDGYNEGLKHYENEKLESIVDGVEYKDLMLSSGTKWATAYLKMECSLIWKRVNLVCHQKRTLRNYVGSVR